MAGYLIFVPEGKPSPAESPWFKGVLKDGDATLKARPDQVGPERQPGTIWFWLDPKNPAANTAVTGYDTTKQTWRRGPGGDFWLGTVDSTPPIPEHLLRWETCRSDGYRVRMCDDRDWIIASGPLLPIDYQLGDDGKLVEAIKTSWKATFERIQEGLQVAEKLASEDGVIDRSNCDWVAGFVGDMLAVNYRVNSTVAALLGLFDPNSLLAALMLATDVATLRSLRDASKKEPASTGSDIGLGGSDYSK